jgi:hypothetical protein
MLLFLSQLSYSNWFSFSVEGWQGKEGVNRRRFLDGALVAAPYFLLSRVRRRFKHKYDRVEPPPTLPRWLFTLLRGRHFERSRYIYYIRVHACVRYFSPTPLTHACCNHLRYQASRARAKGCMPQGGTTPSPMELRSWDYSSEARDHCQHSHRLAHKIISRSSI